ncbi:hypothetical protein GSI_14585 [Ganoderma sinense ZZ0214-1]|uniref:Lysine-specific metallo-endopeptidase domain-containing protein n=1 Tax=Ganoderma sinense ZZ0214-1 TaxID=1077348 RepID=A0A2G8RP27_9APHY|nr:hypothetical protein GSI_14585 [Ganoderma sinense ZZ0214-1]
MLLMTLSSVHNPRHLPQRSCSLPSLRLAVVAVVATATAVAAAPGLSLKVTGPSAVNGVENLQIVTTVTNAGNETLKLLNDPNGVLNPLPADTFTITGNDGASPSTGAAKLTDPAAFTVLEPGATVSVTHDIASAYNLTATGHGQYNIGASNSFYASPTLSGGGLVVLRRPGAVRKRVNFDGCSTEQQSILTAAALGAYEYVTTAWSYITTRARLDTAPGSAARHATVLSHFQRMAGNDFVSFSYNCTCTDPGVFAYVYPDQFGSVHLCGLFWAAPLFGTDSQAGILVHEASHFTVNGGTQDYAYGQPEAQTLAKSNPEQAVMNADNHEYFAENNPAQE